MVAALNYVKKNIINITHKDIEDLIRYNKLRKLKKGKKIDTACMSLVE